MIGKARERWPLLLSAIFLALPTLLVGVAQLHNPGFWYDEAGQFWMSQGLHHYSAPMSAPGSLVEAWRENRSSNLDPGGFTVLLRGWVALFGASTTALRALPYLFYVAMAGGLAVLSRVLIADSAIAAVAPVTLFFYALMTVFATELRAYSMESCGVLWLLIAMLCYQRNPTATRALALGLTGAFFLTSRYSFIVFAVAAGLFLIRRPRHALLYGALTGGTALLLYGTMLRYQSAGMAAPTYVSHTLLRGMAPLDALHLLRVNFLSRPGLPLLGVLAVGIAGRWKRGTAQYTLFLMTALSVAGFALLSLTGKMPWHMEERWSLPLHALSMTCVLALLSRFKAPRRIPLAGKAAVLALLFTYAMTHTLLFKRPLTDSLHLLLPTVAAKANGERMIYVVESANATVRYLMEYGPLKGSMPYPQAFLFETKASNTDSTAIAFVAVNDVGDHGLELVKSRFKRPLKQVPGPGPSFLLKVP